MSQVQLIIPGREKDLGGFHVSRILPYGPHRMVGPFIFLDHMGPENLPPGTGMDVRPHPHINLATCTYLFDGVIEHRDSLGSEQWIEPGAINWMTAGRGIVHSERTPAEIRERGQRLDGLQCWVALPNEFEEIEPAFSHHPATTLPEFRVNQVFFKLLLGSALGQRSPVPVHSDLFYLEAKLQPEQSFTWPADPRENAVYVVRGSVQIQDQKVEAGSMAVGTPGSSLLIESESEPAHLMLLGGSPVGHREIFWNFVSSSKDRLEEVKADWSNGGPRKNSVRFRPIPGDDGEWIPLPRS